MVTMMDIWKQYESRLNVHGATQKQVTENREARFLSKRVKNSLSDFDVIIYPTKHTFNLTEQYDYRDSENVVIIKSDNLDEKVIITLPPYDIAVGSLVNWQNSYWLVDKRDSNTTLYTQGTLKQCNYLLKWVNKDNKIIEQWCVIEDGTKYLIGEYQDNRFITIRGDSRVALWVPANDETKALNRTYHFYINDMCYNLTKPLKGNLGYDHGEYYKYMLQECTGNIYDNKELGIADYYKHFPKEDNNPTIPNNGKKVWL